jgi:hypothetical protein
MVLQVVLHQMVLRGGVAAILLMKSDFVTSGCRGVQYTEAAF